MRRVSRYCSVTKRCVQRLLRTLSHVAHFSPERSAELIVETYLPTLKLQP